jgi:hypothetical protein
VVSGSAGQVGGQQATFPHDAMYYSNSTNGGAMMLEVQGNRLDAKWICADGVIRDRFTMMKDAGKKTMSSVRYGDTVTLSASFIGRYSWSPNSDTTKTIRTAPPAGLDTFTVRDYFSCIADTFIVNVAGSSPSDHFRTRVAGLWNNNEIWESSEDSIVWYRSNLVPDFESRSISLYHTVTVISPITIDQAAVYNPALLNVVPPGELRVMDGAGVDLILYSKEAGGRTQKPVENKPVPSPKKKQD